MQNEDQEMMKVAKKPTLEELGLSEEQIKQIQLGRYLIPRNHLTDLRRAFTPKGIAFWVLYKKLWEVRHGVPVEGDLIGMYRAAFRRLAMLTSPVDKKPLSPAVINALAEHRVAIFKYLRQIQENPNRPRVWTRLNAILMPLMTMVAEDKGIYIKGVRMKGTNPIELWKMFRKQSKAQQKLLRLKAEDPESYQLMLEKGQTMAQIENGIAKKIRDAGQKQSTIKAFNAIISIGTDEAGNRTVYDRDGEVLGMGDWVEKRKTYLKQLNRLKTRTKTINVDLEEIRKISDEEIDELQGEVEFTALTDDKTKHSKDTRYFPVKDKTIFVSGDEGVQVVQQKVIVGGRYKGCYLDDMINDQGRLIEGTAYAYDTKRGESQELPDRIDPSDREPYCTVAYTKKIRTVKGKRTPIKTKKLMIKVSGSRANTELRNALKELCCKGGTKSFSPSGKCIPSMEWHPVEGSKAISVYFDPKDFGLIVGKSSGLTLSKAANKEVKAYYKELTIAEEATKDTEAYKTQLLNSKFNNPATGEEERFEFIEKIGGKDFQLLGKQREALAWLDANGGNGVCALDTGIGKTLTAVGGMMKMVRDGYLSDDASYTRPDGREVKTNGRFLYVCPPSLKGNMDKEIKQFVKGNGGGLAKRVDVLTYSQFARASSNGIIPPDLVKANPDYWGPLKESEKEERRQSRQRNRRTARGWKPKQKYWDAEKYIQIYFDEAHEMKRRESKPAMAALKLWHPRKICLTASPMEKNPMEAYVLSSICNNTPLVGNGIEAKDNRKTMKRFKARFCKNIGGRICGVTDNEEAQRDMKTWVKRNIFYADKTRVDEYDLPAPKIETTVAEMNATVEACYRAVTGQMTTVMQAAAVKFGERRKQDAYRDKAAENLFGLRMRPWVKLLNTLSNRPADAMEDLVNIAQGTIPKSYEYAERYQPKWGQYPRGIKTLGKQLLEILGDKSLDELKASVGNPKLDIAENTIKQKIKAIKGSRALIFCDDKQMCVESVERMSSTMGGVHALCMKDRIELYEGGKPLDQWVVKFDRGDLELLFAGRADEIHDEFGGQSTFQLPFRKITYRKYPNLPPKTQLKRAEGLNEDTKSDQWQQFVLGKIIKKNPKIHTVTLLGEEYSHGHNLQTFDTVIHLDRDHWNSEAMKQRTARAYRQGQSQSVQEVTIDSTYASTEDGDVTLDTIRRLFQEMDASIFDGIIKESQDFDLTAEDGGVLKRDTSNYNLDRDVAALQLSPYASRSKPPGVK